MANLFSEMAHKAIGDLTLKISPDEKRALNIAAGAITSYLGSGDYLSGAVGVSVTEAMQNILKDVKDPTVKEILVGIASATVGKMTNLHVAAALSSAMNTERFNHLSHEDQEKFVAEMEEAAEIEDVVQRQEKRLAIIEEYLKRSDDNRASDPEGAEHMEEALMDVLEVITKYGDCGIHFEVNRDAGLHYNLEAAKLFFREFNIAKHLPEVFEGTVIAATAEITAPIAVVGKALKYGPATYELCTDIINGEGDVLLLDISKHTALNFVSSMAERHGIPMYIIIPSASGAEVFVNVNYREKLIGGD